jgi:ketosteroid isomerase-like protein
MLVRFSLVVSLSLLAFTAACTQAPPPDTHDADVQSLKDTEAAWSKAMEAKDFDKGMTYYADDASLLIANAPAINGKDAIQAAMKPMFDDSNFALAFQASRVEVAKSADLGYTQGAYTMTFTEPRTKKPITDKGKYVTAYKKQSDGTWKAAADMVSSDIPLPAPGKK